jgi:hypothetical protein
MLAFKQYINEATVQSKHLIPAIHIAGHTFLPKKRSDVHGNIISRIHDEHPEIHKQRDRKDPEKHIGFYHLKDRRFIEGRKITSKEDYKRMDSTETPYSTHRRQFGEKSAKNREYEVAETNSHANDNYNPHPPIKKWQDWLKSNKNHPKAYDVASAIQQAQQRIRQNTPLSVIKEMIFK